MMKILMQNSFRANYKIAFLMFLLLLFVVIFCIYYLNNLVYQIIFFVFINIVYVLKLSADDLLKFYKFWYKKVFIYSIFYVLAGLYYINYSEVNPLNTYSYWQHITLRTIIILINTVMFTDILIKQITVTDLFNLKLSVYLKMRLIMFICIYNYLKIQNLHSLEIINIIPEYQKNKRLGFITSTKHNFSKNLVIVLALIYMVQEKSYILGKLIENRFTHLKT